MASSMLAKTPFFRFVSQLLVFTLFFGLIPAPPALASTPPSDRALSLPALPSLAESVPPAVLAVVIAVAGDEVAVPCAVVFVVSDPHMPSKYHRARWYTPTVGRFAGIDLVYGLAEEPTSLHRYLYAVSNPVNRADPSGLLSNFVYGRAVHQVIGVDFISADPGMRDADIGVSTIIGNIVPWFGRLRPDLIDYRNKQIYEIKTVRGYGEGLWQIMGYLLMLNWADPDKTHPWSAGFPGGLGFPMGYTPPKAFPVGPLATAITFPPIGGVITYEVFDALPIVLGLAAVVAKSTASMMTQVGAQTGISISLTTMAPVG